MPSIQRASVFENTGTLHKGTKCRHYVEFGSTVGFKSNYDSNGFAPVVAPVEDIDLLLLCISVPCGQQP